MTRPAALRGRSCDGIGSARGVGEQTWDRVSRIRVLLNLVAFPKIQVSGHDDLFSGTESGPDVLEAFGIGPKLDRAQGCKTIRDYEYLRLLFQRTDQGNSGYSQAGDGRTDPDQDTHAG